MREPEQDLPETVPAEVLLPLHVRVLLSHYVTIGILILTRFHLWLPDWRGYILAGFSLVWIANVLMSLFGELRLEIRHDRQVINITEEEIAEDHAHDAAHGKPVVDATPWSFPSHPAPASEPLQSAGWTLNAAPCRPGGQLLVLDLSLIAPGSRSPLAALTKARRLSDDPSMARSRHAPFTTACGARIAGTEVAAEDSLRPTSGFALRSARSEVGSRPALSAGPTSQ